MSTTTNQRRLEKANRITLIVLTVLALVYAAGALLGGVLGLAGSLSSGEQTYRLEVQEPFAPLPGGESGQGGASVVEAEYRTAVVGIAGLDGGIVAATAVARALGVLTEVGVALAAAWLGWSLLRARPFAPSVIRAVTAAAVALIVGGVFSQGLLGVASWSAIVAVGSDSFPLVMTFDPTPFVAGIALGLVGAAFEVGTRLQRDTEGLV
jgi:hypothetical protein